MHLVVHKLFGRKLLSVLAVFGERDRIVVLGDLNARVGDMGVEDIIGEHRVPGVRENGEKLLKFCAERGMVVGNIW